MQKMPILPRDSDCSTCTGFFGSVGKWVIGASWMILTLFATAVSIYLLNWQQDHPLTPNTPFNPNGTDSFMLQMVYGESASWAPLKTTEFSFGANVTFAGILLPTGVAIKSGSSSWAVYSDRRLKENIEDVDPLESARLMEAINIKTFNYKTSPENKEIGLIAQDLEVPCPECVKPAPHPSLPDALGVEHHVLSVHALNALKYALREIAELKKTCAKQTSTAVLKESVAVAA
jgi:Chaperone of endosialidase